MRSPHIDEVELAQRTWHDDRYQENARKQFPPRSRGFCEFFSRVQLAAYPGFVERLLLSKRCRSADTEVPMNLCRAYAQPRDTKRGIA